MEQAHPNWLLLPRNVWSLVVSEAIEMDWGACMRVEWSWMDLRYVCRFMLTIPVIKAFMELKDAAVRLRRELGTLGASIWRLDTPEAGKKSSLRVCLVKRVYNDFNFGPDVFSTRLTMGPNTPHCPTLPHIVMHRKERVYASVHDRDGSLLFKSYTRSYKYVRIILYHPMVHCLDQLVNHYGEYGIITDNLSLSEFYWHLDSSNTVVLLCNIRTLWTHNTPEDCQALRVFGIYQYTRMRKPRDEIGSSATPALTVRIIDTDQTTPVSERCYEAATKRARTCT